jgi:hypothetical protein
MSQEESNPTIHHTIGDVVVDAIVLYLAGWTITCHIGLIFELSFNEILSLSLLALPLLAVPFLWQASCRIPSIGRRAGSSETLGFARIGPRRLSVGKPPMSPSSSRRQRWELRSESGPPPPPRS